MDVSMIHLPPGDPGLIDKIVCQLKSNGIFDQFRKECIADVDTKPAYQNLRQRVEGSVSSFLSNQEWKPDLNKNQLRDSLRKHIHESGFLDIGVERIVDQVVNPKMYTVFFPKVEDVVYEFLRLEKPKKGTDALHSVHYGIPKPGESKPEKKFVSLKDLLPTDLDPISPEKLESDEGEMEEAQNASQEDFDAAKVVETVAPRAKGEESAEVGVEWGPRGNGPEEGNGAVEEEGEEEDEEEEEEDEASPPFESLDAEPKPTVSLAAVASDMLDNITSSSSSSSSASEAKEVPLQFPEAPRGVPPPFGEAPKGAGSPKGEDRRGPSPPVAPAEKEERREEKRRREEGGVREEGGGKGGEDKARGGEAGRREKEGKRREEGSRGERKEGGGGSQPSSSSRRDKSRSSEDKRRERRDEHHHHHGSSSSSSSKRTEGSRRAEGSGKEDEHWKQKKSKERGHSSSSGSKDKAGAAVPSTTRRPGGEKASHHGSHHHHHGSSGSSHRSNSSGGGHRHSGERKDEGKERSGSKKKSTDDHRYERDKKGRDGHRRWDRERSREGRGGCGEQGSGSGSKQPVASGASSSGGGAGKGDGGGGASECGEGERSRKREAGGEGERKPPPVEKAAGQESTGGGGGGSAPGVPPPLTKMKKPKIAANVFEVKKIIQERKRLEREKAEAEEAAAAAVKAAAEAGEQKREGASLLRDDECPSERDADSLGEVLYLEELPDSGFVSYVHGLTQEAEGGDFSRVPIVGVPPQDSSEDGSSSADYLELSDVDLSREEQETLTRLGACVERKQREEAKIEATTASPVPLVAKCQVEEEGSSSGKRPRRPNPRYNSGEYSTYSDEEGGLLEGEQGSEGEDEEDDLSRQPLESAPSLVEGHPPIDMGPDGGEGGGLSGGHRRRRGPVVGRRLGVRGPLRRVVTPDAFVMPLSPESDVSTASGEAGRKALPVSKESHADAELVLQDFESESRHPQPPPLLMVMGVGDGYQHPAAECDKTQAEGIIGGVGGHPSCRLDDGEQRRHDESPASLGTRRMRGTRSSSRVQQRYSSDDLYKPRPNITLGRRNRGKNSPSQEDSFLEGEGDGERGSPVVGDVVLAGPVEATASLAVDSLPNKKRRR